MRSDLICVLTTVQEPTACARSLSRTLERHHAELIVIGDRKGPTQFDLPGCRFFSIEHQLDLPLKLARLVPEKHYARKNLGYLLAFKAGASRIYETDDDNEPLPHWKPLDRQVEARKASAPRWLNVYRLFTRELIWPRGLPLDQINHPSSTGTIDPAASRITAPIQQGLANGAPDVDAVWRLVMDRDFRFDAGPSVRLPPGTWCPFNSQNTWWWPEAFALMYLPAFCTFRMTDIWRSFVAQRCLWEMGHGLVFHPADVVQLRNVHNLMRDFMDEVPGYEHNERIVGTLQDLKLGAGQQDVAENLVRCYEALIAGKFLPSDEMPLVRAWLDDCNAALPQSQFHSSR